MEKPVFLEQLESRLLLNAVAQVGVTAFTVSPVVIEYAGEGPSGMTVTLHNYGNADLVN